MNKNSFLRIVKYLLVARSAGIIEFGTFTLLTLMGVWPYWPCYLDCAGFQCALEFYIKQEVYIPVYSKRSCSHV